MVVAGEGLPEQIADACRTFEEERATRLSKELAAKIRSEPRVCAFADVQPTLALLRRMRYFEAVLAVTEAVIESGQPADDARISYAQALIDTGRIAAALAILTEVVGRAPKGSFGSIEGQGLIGRLYKQLYVDGAGEETLRDERLRRAFNAYYDAYSEDPDRYWHGVNAAALLWRAGHDGKALRAVDPFTKRLEAQTLELTARSTDDPWPIVTSAEAALALNLHDEAIERYARFVATDPTIVGAFEIFSAYRQLIDVWLLTEDAEPGSTLLPMLRGAYLQRSGGNVALGGSNLRNDLARVTVLAEKYEAQRQREQSNEKSFSSTMFKTLKWYRSGLERCNSVCRINDIQGAGIGTGFLVRGGDFHETLGDEKLVLTNAHVLSLTYANALSEGEAVATFEAAGDGKEYLLEEIVWTDNDLDATLARASEALPANGAYDIAKRLPNNDQTQRVYVIGHPNGGGLSLSLNDNVLLDYDERVAHYRAPTEGGSSGSPVFNSDWKLIALHHRGDFTAHRLTGKAGTYEANEGILVARIVEAARKAVI
jgi:tetratricopeptide (TPR) repeat protein